MKGGYGNLEVYRQAHELAVRVHRTTMDLPRFEMFEEGGQIRRSAKSVAAQIVEGYCLRKNKGEFLQYINRAYASAHETLEHLELLVETGSLADDAEYRSLQEGYDLLCRQLLRFMEAVVHGHALPGFVAGSSHAPGTSQIPHPTSGS